MTSIPSFSGRKNIQDDQVYAFPRIELYPRRSVGCLDDLMAFAEKRLAEHFSHLVVIFYDENPCHRCVPPLFGISDALVALFFQACRNWVRRRSRGFLA